MSQRNIFICLLSVLVIQVTMGNTDAQVVVPDGKKFAEKECRWLYTQFLDECAALSQCTGRAEERDFSMSTQRGISSLETVLTVRAASEINTACEKVCNSKKKPSYADWRRSICVALIK